MKHHHKCRPTKPPQSVVDHVNSALNHEDAVLGRGMSDQTKYALMSMRDFLHQPAEAYCSCNFTERDIGMLLEGFDP